MDSTANIFHQIQSTIMTKKTPKSSDDYDEEQHMLLSSSIGKRKEFPLEVQALLHSKQLSLMYIIINVATLVYLYIFSYRVKLEKTNSGMAVLSVSPNTFWMSNAVSTSLYIVIITKYLTNLKRKLIISSVNVLDGIIFYFIVGVCIISQWLVIVLSLVMVIPGLKAVEIWIFEEVNTAIFDIIVLSICVCGIAFGTLVGILKYNDKMEIVNFWNILTCYLAICVGGYFLIMINKQISIWGYATKNGFQGEINENKNVWLYFGYIGAILLNSLVTLEV